MNYLATLAQECSEGLALEIECSCNAMIHIFSLSGEGDHPCLREKNPFLSKNTVVKPILSIPAIAITSVSADRNEKEHGAIESQNRKVTIAGCALDVQTGWWAYIDMLGDLLGGRITRIARDKMIMSDLYIDMSKPVPFRPELAQVGEWRRGVQV